MIRAPPRPTRPDPRVPYTALFRSCVPNLDGVVGASKAHLEGFSFSSAMQEAGGEWTYEDLNHFIADPKGLIAGTKMTFAGVRSAEDRADIIAYLRQQSDNPPPLPEVQPAGEQPAGQQPAGQQPAGQQPAGQQIGRAHV